MVTIFDLFKWVKSYSKKSNFWIYGLLGSISIATNLVRNKSLNAPFPAEGSKRTNEFKSILALILENNSCAILGFV